MGHIVIDTSSPTSDSRLNRLIQYVESKWAAADIKIGYIRVSELPAKRCCMPNSARQAAIAVGLSGNRFVMVLVI